MNLIHVIRGAFSFSFKFTISCPNNLKVGILYPIIGKSIQWKQCFMFISFLYKWIGKLEFSFKEVKPHPLHIVAEKNIFQQLSLGYFCWYFAKYMDWRKKIKEWVQVWYFLLHCKIFNWQRMDFLIKCQNLRSENICQSLCTICELFLIHMTAKNLKWFNLSL